ncbi:Jrk-like [Chelydra serpentina]|uniref:Jrk-like n=1 Tax=Chelydra serpentina TaxID=8475 RepID=A0A8T1S1K2_CHESE|nr:Jrk-like [Chelydra serpentina]
MLGKRKAYTVQENLDAIEQHRNGETQAKISHDIGINESTFRGWLKNVDKLGRYMHNLDKEHCLLKKRARLANDADLDSAGYTWFVQEQQKSIPISGPLIAMQAEKFDRELNDKCSNFKASLGWLWRFQKRHVISQIAISGEKRSADAAAMQSYPAKLREILQTEGYSEEQVYNADVRGIYYKMLPDKTLAVRTDERKKEGYKQAKDHLTLLFCVNATGKHKLKPLSIGKSRMPRCFHHVNVNCLPFLYKNSKNSWMTGEIFEQWFFTEFVPSVRKHLRAKRLEEKAILLLDNCPAHPLAKRLRTHDGKIQVEYLPTNTTSKIQPLDQGVIAIFKQHYRQNLVRQMIESELSVTDFLKKLTIKDFFYISAEIPGIY